MYRKIGILCAGDSELAPFLPHLEHARTSEYPVRFGRMVTGEAFITDDGRQEINARFAPLTVDMESAAVAHVCHANDVPFLAIRTVTDTADHSGTGNFELNCEKASAIAKDFTLALLREIQNA